MSSGGSGRKLFYFTAACAMAAGAYFYVKKNSQELKKTKKAKSSKLKLFMMSLFNIIRFRKVNSPNLSQSKPVKALE